MKAIIPVAGAGTKLRPHTYTQPKALIPLAGKTILSIIVDQLIDAGVKEYIFIIGYLGAKIQDYVLENYPQLTVHFITQTDRQGIGHAIGLAKEAVDNDEIVIVLGDTIAEFDMAELLASPTSMIGIKKVDDPRNFGVAELSDDSMRILRVVEKPTIPKSNMAMVGIYKIKETPLMFSCIASLEKQSEGLHSSISLTDAMSCMLQAGVEMHSFKVKNWFDCGRKDTLLSSNATLLKKFGGNSEEQHSYINTVIIPPVFIGNGCLIKNAVIGPNVVIGDHSTIDHAILKDSIIGAYSHLFEIVLSHSLIGSDAEVRGVSRSLNVGDNTAINLGGGLTEYES